VVLSEKIFGLRQRKEKVKHVKLRGQRILSRKKVRCKTSKVEICFG
jgi:hypothetical protein